MRSIIKNKKYNVLVAFILLSISIALISNKSTDNVTLDEVKLKDNEVSKKQFAMYTRDSEDSEYIEYTGEDLFPKGYILNIDQSSCMDINGDEVTTEEVISQTDGGKIMVTSTKTVYCTFYFDKEPTTGDAFKDKVGQSGLIQTSDASDLKYRYVGTNSTVTNNYICFGTTNKDDCIKSNSNYLYRIIGIDTNGRLKLIKDTALNTSTQWHNNYSDNAVWDAANNEKLEAYLHESLNNTTFLNNNTYVPNDWKDKIDKTKWNIGDVNNASYAQSGGDAISTQEQTASATTASEIGLMYLSDYYYSLDGEGKTNCRDGGTDVYAKCKTSWLHISNNSSSQNNTEWTMTRYSLFGGTYSAWFVYDGGAVSWTNLNNTYAVRPVFYLTSDSKIVDGSGTISDPYILEGPGEKIAKEKFNGEIPSGFNTTLVADMYRFVGNQVLDTQGNIKNYVCFGASDCNKETTNDHLYRIIGITSDGKIKIQKNKALESSAQWNDKYSSSDCSGTNCTWEQSTMYTSTLTSTFYGSSDYVTEDMKSKIDTTHQWNIGDVGIRQYTDGTTVYNAENTGDKHPGAVGLAYLSDYYFAYNEEGTQKCTNGCLSWMIPTNGDLSSLWYSNGANYEWTMTRYGELSSTYNAWYVYPDGLVGYPNFIVEYAVRPVFYLNSDVKISGGEGTLESPFVIN